MLAGRFGFAALACGDEEEDEERWRRSPMLGPRAGRLPPQPCRGAQATVAAAVWPA